MVFVAEPTVTIALWGVAMVAQNGQRETTLGKENAVIAMVELTA